MTDITMCKGTGCEFKQTCHRHTAKEKPLMQSYFTNSPVEDGACE